MSGLTSAATSIHENEHGDAISRTVNVSVKMLLPATFLWRNFGLKSLLAYGTERMPQKLFVALLGMLVNTNTPLSLVAY